MFAKMREWFPFHGRISRSGFWITYLLAAIPLVLGSAVLGGLGESISSAPNASAVEIAVIVAFVLAYMFFAFWIGISLYVRRAHDLGWSGRKWWWLMVPFVNVWAMFKLLFRAGETQANAYGEPD